MKKVSVLIPSYNHEKFIGKAIESALNQTIKNIEIIIMDDFSIDNSKKVINSFNDKRIKKFFSDKNEGAVANLNKLIDLASGEYIAVLNSDDYWEKNKLKVQVEYMDSHKKVGACFTWADFIDENGSEILDENRIFLGLFRKENVSREQWFNNLFYYGNCLCHPSVLIRKEVYNQLGKYKETYRQLPDYEMWIRVLKKFDIHIIEENLTHFRILDGKIKNSSFISEKSKNLINYEEYMIKNEYFNNCDDKFFCNSFKDELINNDCLKNKIAVEFEKNIILYNCHFYKQVGRYIAYNNIARILENEENKNLLLNMYSFDLNKFYDLGSQITDIEAVISDTKAIEVVPNYILNSKGYRFVDHLYRTSAYKVYSKLRKALNKSFNK